MKHQLGYSGLKISKEPSVSTPKGVHYKPSIIFAVTDVTNKLVLKEYVVSTIVLDVYLKIVHRVALKSTRMYDARQLEKEALSEEFVFPLFYLYTHGRGQP